MREKKKKKKKRKKEFESIESCSECVPWYFRHTLTQKYNINTLAPSTCMALYNPRPTFATPAITPKVLIIGFNARPAA